jgi:hypothetical protein
MKNGVMTRTLALAFIFCVLTTQLSCTSMKSVSMDRASSMQTRKDYIVLHTPNKIYKVVNYEFSNDSLIGEMSRFSGSKNGVVHVYTNMIFDLTFDSESFKNLNLPRSHIHRIAFKKFSIVKTTALMGIILTGGIYYLNNMNLGFGEFELGF